MLMGKHTYQSCYFAFLTNTFVADFTTPKPVELSQLEAVRNTSSVAPATTVSKMFANFTTQKPDVPVFSGIFGSSGFLLPFWSFLFLVACSVFSTAGDK